MDIVPQIPDLPDKHSVSVQFFAQRVFLGGGPQHRDAYALVMNFIRMTDLASHEYAEGQKSSNEFWTTHDSLRISSAILSTAHFEVCIDAVKRAINFLKAIRGNPNVPQSLKDLLPRGLKLLSGEVEGKITDMRDAIQHLEERIYKGEIGSDENFVLRGERDSLQLGSTAITYTELVGWLVEAHDLATKMSSFRETPAA
jgi:hypothetical protein